MDTLDKRYHSKQKTEGAVFPKKTRHEGSQSQSLPPEDAPKWAVKEGWTQDPSVDSGNGNFRIIIVALSITIINNNRFKFFCH